MSEKLEPAEALRQLRTAYSAWAREEGEAIYVLEAVGSFLKSASASTLLTAARAEARPAVDRLDWRPVNELPITPTDDTWRILAFCPASGRAVQELYRYQEYEAGPWSWQTPPGVSGRGYLVLPEAISLWCKIPEPPTLLSPATSPGEGEGRAPLSEKGVAKP